MLTPIGVVLVGIGFLFSCLITIYLYSIRINSRSSAIKKEEVTIENVEGSINKSERKKNKKKAKEQVHNQEHSSNVNSSLTSVVSPAESVSKFDDEDDILALASLKGYDTSKIRRRSPKEEKAEIIAEKKSSVEIPEAKVVPIVEKVVAIESNEIVSSTFEVPSNEEVFSESIVTTVVVEEWSHIPTREEEAAKNLKNKLTALEQEVQESERKLLQNSRLLEQSQKRINLLEQELKEQRKVSSGTKSALEAQIASLRAINHEMAGKLMIVEADASNSALFKGESDRAREANVRLQADLRRVQEEKAEILRQISELKTENGFLREQAYLADSLNVKCLALEEDLEEVRRQMELQVETAETELKLTRAKLESEIAFHRAEHANSVGSSTALHQEISQLKSELGKLTEIEEKAREFENLNSQLLGRIEECESKGSDEVDALKTELEAAQKSLFETDKLVQSKIEEIYILQSDLNNFEMTKSKLTACETEIASLTNEISHLKSQTVEKSDSTEILNLCNQLAEAEIKISGLQSDLAREIKRADIAKKVYETKLALLEKESN